MENLLLSFQDTQAVVQDKQNFIVEEAIVMDGDITPAMSPTGNSPVETAVNTPMEDVFPVDKVVFDTSIKSIDMPVTDILAPVCVENPQFGAKTAPLSLTPLDTRMVPSEKPLSGATKLRKMIFGTQELVVCPGVYDGLSARTALEVGFKALYMTGAGTTASRLGQPDLAIAQFYEMRENADMIAGLDPYGPPLIADMDTGYGGPLMVARTVEHYIRSGVAGAHLEDQVLMKRCGHLGGKKVVPRDDYLQRIRAAHHARLRLQSDFVLIARTDALQSMGYDECIARLKAARDIGADVGLLEGFKTKEQAAQAVKDLHPWPLLYNSVENGASPTITVDEARIMGFRIMIFSFATLAPAYTAIRDALFRLKTQGAVGTPSEITPVRLFEVCGLEHSMSIDMEAGGSAFDQDVAKV